MSKDYLLTFIINLTHKKKLEEYKTINKYIIDEIIDGIIIVNKDGLVTFSNKSLTNIFGYTSEELAGQPIEMLIP